MKEELGAADDVDSFAEFHENEEFVLATSKVIALLSKMRKGCTSIRPLTASFHERENKLSAVLKANDVQTECTH